MSSDRRINALQPIKFPTNIGFCLMNERHIDHPKVVAVPPLIYFGFFCLGLILEYFWRTEVFAPPLRLLVGVFLIAVGLLLGFQAFREFRQAETSVEVYKPSTALVTKGPYSYTRNPIYVGLTLAYVGAALVADSLWILGLLAPILLIMHYGVVVREENYLMRKFGTAYRQYQESVRRWL
jgi:protein-S-isoprenylcysteine O-methyltransferase Ste14